MKKVILIAGGQGAGKTTLADHLVSVLTNATRLSFADPMRALVKGLMDAVDTIGLDLPNPDLRTLYQLIGTEWGRNIDDLLWVKHAQKKTQQLSYDCAIYDDLRFRNEFDAFPDAIRIRLECPAEIRQKRAKYWGNPDHPSENDLNSYHDKYDAIFDSSGDVKDTHAQVSKWLQNKFSMPAGSL